MRLLACAAIAGLALGSASTGALADEAQGAYPENESWTFQLSPYVWFSGMSGKVAVNDRLPVVDVDISFEEIFDHIDWWPPPVMLVGEARKGGFAFVSDFMFLGLESDAERAIGPIPLSVRGQQDTIIWSLYTSFRLADEKSWSLDLLAGWRLWSVEAEGTLNVALAERVRSGTKTWVDPIVGAVGRVDLGGGFGLQVEGDIGGFGLASDLDWQLVGLVRYAISESISLEAGYRHLSVDYSNDEFLLDAALSGPLVGARFRF